MVNRSANPTSAAGKLGELWGKIAKKHPIPLVDQGQVHRVLDYDGFLPTEENVHDFCAGWVAAGQQPLLKPLED